jgi:hypothetical protein
LQGPQPPSMVEQPEAGLADCAGRNLDLRPAGRDRGILSAWMSIGVTIRGDNPAAIPDRSRAAYMGITKQRVGSLITCASFDPPK